ncbi:hypothetical protein D3C79_780390 [compost metagenome]
MRPTKCCLTRASVRRSTSTVMPASTRAWVAVVQALVAPTSPISLAMCSATSSAVVVAVDVVVPHAAATCATPSS